MLRAEQVVMRYAGSAAPVVDGASVAVAPGELVAVVGANGSGKSTLARLLAGSLVPTSGTVFLDEAAGHVGWPHVGILHQDPEDQLVSEVVLDEVSFGLRNLGVERAEAERQGFLALEALGIAHLADGRTSKLSGGEKQRLALAGLVVAKPAYLVLDEPTSMLDSTSRNTFADIVLGLVDEGCGILMVTHYLREVMLSDRVLIMDAGRIVWSGAPEDFLADAELLRVAAIDELDVTMMTHPDDMPHLEGYSNALRGAESDLLMLGDVDVIRGDVSVLKGVSASFGPGRVTLVAGRMGSGKSSLLGVAAGVVATDHGKATLRGQGVRTGDVGLVMQRAEDMLFCSSVLEDVCFGPLNLGLEEVEATERAADALRSVGLAEGLWTHAADELSGGEQRLAAIASMLAVERDAILFDEPTAGLDGRGRARIRALVRGLADEGAIVVVCTHDVDEWLPVADDVILLKGGGVSFAGTRDAAIASAAPWAACGLIAPSWIWDTAHAEATAKMARPAPVSLDDLSGEGRDATAFFTAARHAHARSVCALVATLALSVATFAVHTWAGLLAMGVMVALFAHLCHVRLREALEVLKVAAVVLAFAFLGNALAVDGSGDVGLIGPIGVSLAGLGRGVFAVGRIYLLCLTARAVSRVVTASDIARMVTAPVRLLAWTGLDAAAAELVVTITLRMIPTTIEALERVVKMQAIRGAKLLSGGMRERLSAWTCVLAPVTIATMRHSDALAQALVERGFDPGGKADDRTTEHAEE